MSTIGEEDPNGTTTEQKALNGTTSEPGKTEAVSNALNDQEDPHSKEKENTSSEPIRKSTRLSTPTDRMMEYMEEEANKRERRFHLCFECWKSEVRESRQNMNESNEEDLGHMIDSITKREEEVLQAFQHLRNAASAPNPAVVRKADACVAITKDMVRFMNEKISGIDEAMDNRKYLKCNEYAKSVFSDLSRSSVSGSGSQISNKYADALADLATKKVELESIKYEEEQQAKFEALKEQQRQLIETHQHEVKRMQARKSVAIAEARLKAYSDLMQTNVNTTTNCHPTVTQSLPHIQSSPPINSTLVNINGTMNDASETSTLAKVFADSVNLNRLPIPEPSVFTGDPLRFVEWKTSFHALIERKGIPEQERLFYLKKYVAGEALQAIDGFFYSGSSSAYNNARQVLQDRYGHPFVMQKAFRKRLENWPKIGEGNSKALRDFGDFLQACRDATPQIPSLRILDDCSENQKLLSKLPTWAAMRWNRQVQESIDATGDYPTFFKFVDFVVKEARIACNPVSSLSAINDSNVKPTKEQRNLGSRKVNVLATTLSNQHNGKASDLRTSVCECCEREGHPLYKCERFAGLTITEKRDLVRTKNLCFGCLRKGHRNKDCRRKHTCGICKGKHPSCLHEDRPPIREQHCEVREASSFRVSRGYTHSTSMIVPVWVSAQDNPSHEILTYALLDTQSDTTFILDETAAALHTKAQPIRLSLSTMTSQHTIINSSRIQNLRVRGLKSSDFVTIDCAYTRDFIPADRSHIPERKTVMNWPHLQEISNELPPLQSCEVGLPIGYNCPQALSPRRTLVGKDNQPYGIQTVLGWSVVGYTESSGHDVAVISHRTSVKEVHYCPPKDVIKVFERDFAHDKNEDVKISQDDLAFLNFMEQNIRQQEDMHLEMPLPFKERPTLPNNKSLALIRLNHLKRKLRKDQTYHEHYKTFMKEILDRGDAEPVTADGSSGNTWYIPHHGVYHPRKPGKLRVVFDCSARYKDTSLNEHLLTGPDLTNALTGVLCRFRQYPIAVMCDVEKMFHQFMVEKSDRDYLRFLWWEDGNLDTEPREYRMRVHLFGAASSPGCANYGLKFLARNQEEHFPTASFFVQNDFYVGDGLTSVETEEEAIQLIQDAQTLCANGGLRLHKFISNNKNVINSVAGSERAADVKDLDLAHEQLPVEQALGIKWSIEEDAFCFKTTDQNTTPTRRNMLSIVASIFDPLGFLSPFTLNGKRILQEMCQGSIGWNDPLPADRQPIWEAWIKDLHNIDLIKVPRCLIPGEFGRPDSIELHHFSDASTSGYGQCSYLRVVKGSAVHCTLVIAKARVAPLKVVTIPRLELTAAVLSVKMSLFLKRELNLSINREYFWTDSKVVLGYINNEARRFHVFVANRVQTIRDATEPHQWCYIESPSNPADHASRGLHVAEINDSSWLTGPPLLWQLNIESQNVKAELQLGDPEVKSARSFCCKTEIQSNILGFVSRSSSWTKTISVIARIQRLSNGVKGTHPPTTDERCKAEQTIVKLVQHDAFQDTISVLGKLEMLPRSNSLKPLEPYLQDGMLRVGGRLRKADLPSSCKNPIILPKESHITHLILSLMPMSKLFIKGEA
ncbi:uncharacterized protein LOC111100747 [Crassostrea virginica]